MDTSVSSFTTASLENTVTRPSNAIRQSIRAKTLKNRDVLQPVIEAIKALAITAEKKSKRTENE